MKVVREEMLKLAETITGAELNKAKEYILGHLPLSLEGSMDIAQFYGMRALMLDEIRQPEEIKEAIEKITLDEVKEITRELVREERIRSVVVGPKAGCGLPV